MIKKESIGQRGVTAQKMTEAHLKFLNTSCATFTFERMPDAKAARGALKKSLSDYLCWYLDKRNGGISHHVPLEVKSTEHDYRLTHGSLTQLPKLNLLAKCGAKPYVLVLFKGLEKWRVAPISYFTVGATSWDMRDLPLYDSVQDALESTGKFPRV